MVQRFSRLIVLVLVAWSCGCVSEATAEPQENAAPIDFDKQIAPILIAHCLECHDGTSPEGGLALVSAESATRGGESGRAIVPGDADGSLLWARVNADEMPPKRPLSEQDKGLLRQWLEAGAPWGDGTLDPLAESTSTRAGRDWWSLQPLTAPAIPWPADGEGSGNAIDAFVLQGLRREGLSFSPAADPRTLIRRLHFDLVGLPPTPQQVAAFVADPSEAAYQRVIDELLASPHYGERWGRHWLDVVRFGESDGFERNNPRDHAWPYRDWVIGALNDDMPYDEFARMQLVGDQLRGGVEGAAATGFWVAGVHNTVVGGSDRMRQLARQDEIEEVLATVGQTFTGLTLNCARCHDHKFDPITQKEYYQLASAISGLGYGERVEQSPEELAGLRVIEHRLGELQAELAALDLRTRREILAARQAGQVATPEPPQPFALWEFDVDLSDSFGNLHGRALGPARVADGALILDGSGFVETSPLPRDIGAKTLEVWVQLDRPDQRGGAAMSLETRDGNLFDAIVFGEQEPNRWMAGSNGFARTASFGAPEETEAMTRPVQIAIVYQEDGTITGYRDGVAYGHSIRQSPLQTYRQGESEILFGLRHKPAGGNRHLTARVHRAAFYDTALTPEEVAAAAGNSAGYVSEAQIAAWLGEPQRAHRAGLQAEIATAALARDRQTEKANRKIFTLTAEGAKKTNVLLRGDPDQVGEVVSPAAISAIPGLPGEFGLTPEAPEAERRRKLADWVTDKANPLFARVIVNRVWHYHFGVGIVDTPNDFGFNGGRPTHPELLDHLATQFRAQGNRLKPLHRQIVSSRAYRQAAYGLPAAGRKRAEGIDANNRWLWRGQPRRLEAETLRDAILSVSGTLNPVPGGPSFKDVSVDFNSGTHYYEPLDLEGPEFSRRTVYRFNPRGGRSALLDTFDCPDTASTAPKRSVTTTPLQSLSLMNNAFVLRMSEKFADRVTREAGEDPTSRVTWAWQLAIGREPNEQERQLSERLVSQHGLAALARGLFNFNEFVLIE